MRPAPRITSAPRPQVGALAVGLNYKLGYDDSLDVVGVHLVGGILGCLYLGFFSTDQINPAATNGLFFGGGGTLLGKQAVAALSVFAYSFTVAFLLGWIIDKTIGFRISHDAEVAGIDLNEHSETAYEFDTQSDLNERRVTEMAAGGRNGGRERGRVVGQYVHHFRARRPGRKVAERARAGQSG